LNTDITLSREPGADDDVVDAPYDSMVAYLGQLSALAYGRDLLGPTYCYRPLPAPPMGHSESLNAAIVRAGEAIVGTESEAHG
jgi:hypothetical protein